jgi:hypothetical protein
MNRSFDERISREHFVVRITSITADGIWGTHPYNNDLVSFYSLQHVISIHEEVELDLNNPEHTEMIKEYEEKTGQKIQGDLVKKPISKPQELLPVLDEAPSPVVDDTTGDATFVDIANLEALASHSKKTFDAEDSARKF